MKRRVLLVDDEISILLTLKAVLEISGFDVDTAASAREGKLLLRQRQYDMIITDMRMESDAAGAEVIASARTAPYRPAVALLSAYPVSEEDWQQMGADQMLVKPMQTHALLHQMEALLVRRADDLARISAAAKKPATKAVKKSAPRKKAAKKKSAKTAVSKKKAAKKKPAKTSVSKKTAVRKKSPKTAVKKAVVKKKSTTKTTARKPAKKKSAKKAPRRR